MLPDVSRTRTTAGSDIAFREKDSRVFTQIHNLQVLHAQHAYRQQDRHFTRTHDLMRHMQSKHTNLGSLRRKVKTEGMHGDEEYRTTDVVIPSSACEKGSDTGINANPYSKFEPVY